MKKLLLATLLASACGLSIAQSNVNVYGLLDVGVVTATNVGTAGQNATQVLSSPMWASRIGFKSAEDLGGGTKAGANIEAQINPTDGSQGASSSSGTANNVFSRAANVYLDNAGLGRVTLGRQDNLAFESFAVGDVNAGRNFGGSLNYWNDGSTFGGTSTAKTGLATMTGTTFLSNAVRLDTPVIAGFKGSVQYTSGGVADNTTFGALDASSRRLYAVSYNRGAFNGSASYQTSNNAAGLATAETTTVGGNYTIDKFKVAAGWANFQNPNGLNAANTDFDLRQVSVKYNATSKVDVTAGYYNLKDNISSANGSQTWSLVGDYNFSKRTTAYLGVASTANKGTSGFAPYGAGGANYGSLYGTATYPSVVASTGTTQNAYVVGMTHRF